jgi:hypothetical protein
MMVNMDRWVHNIILTVVDFVHLWRIPVELLYLHQEYVCVIINSSVLMNAIFMVSVVMNGVIVVNLMKLKDSLVLMGNI